MISIQVGIRYQRSSTFCTNAIEILSAAYAHRLTHIDNRFCEVSATCINVEQLKAENISLCLTGYWLAFYVTQYIETQLYHYCIYRLCFSCGTAISYKDIYCYIVNMLHFQCRNNVLFTCRCSEAEHLEWENVDGSSFYACYSIATVS